MRLLACFIYVFAFCVLNRIVDPNMSVLQKSIRADATVINNDTSQRVIISLCGRRCTGVPNKLQPFYNERSNYPDDSTPVIVLVDSTMNESFSRILVSRHRESANINNLLFILKTFPSVLEAIFPPTFASSVPIAVIMISCALLLCRRYHNHRYHPSGRRRKKPMAQSSKGAMSLLPSAPPKIPSLASECSTTKRNLNINTHALELPETFTPSLAEINERRLRLEIRALEAVVFGGKGETDNDQEQGGANAAIAADTVISMSPLREAIKQLQSRSMSLAAICEEKEGAIDQFSRESARLEEALALAKHRGEQTEAAYQVELASLNVTQQRRVEELNDMIAHQQSEFESAISQINTKQLAIESAFANERCDMLKAQEEAVAAFSIELSARQSLYESCEADFKASFEAERQEVIKAHEDAKATFALELASCMSAHAGILSELKREFETERSDLDKVQKEVTADFVLQLSTQHAAHEEQVKNMKTAFAIERQQLLGEREATSAAHALEVATRQSDFESQRVEMKKAFEAEREKFVAAYEDARAAFSRELSARKLEYAMQLAELKQEFDDVRQKLIEERKSDLKNFDLELSACESNYEQQEILLKTNFEAGREELVKRIEEEKATFHLALADRDASFERKQADLLAAFEDERKALIQSHEDTQARFKLAISDRDSEYSGKVASLQESFRTERDSLLKARVAETAALRQQLHEQLLEKETELLQAQEVIARLTLSIEQLESEVSSLKSEADSLEANVRDLSGALGDSEVRCAILGNQLTDKENELEATTHSLRESELGREQLERDFAGIRNREGELKNELGARDILITKLFGDIEGSHAQIAERDHKITSSDDSLRQAAESVVALSQELAAVHITVAAKQSEIDALKDELHRHIEMHSIATAKREEKLQALQALTDARAIEVENSAGKLLDLQKKLVDQQDSYEVAMDAKIAEMAAVRSALDVALVEKAQLEDQIFRDSTEHDALIARLQQELQEELHIASEARQDLLESLSLAQDRVCALQAEVGRLEAAVNDLGMVKSHTEKDLVSARSVLESARRDLNAALSEKARLEDQLRQKESHIATLQQQQQQESATASEARQDIADALSRERKRSQNLQKVCMDQSSAQMQLQREHQEALDLVHQHTMRVVELSKELTSLSEQFAVEKEVIGKIKDAELAVLKGEHQDQLNALIRDRDQLIATHMSTVKVAQERHEVAVSDAIAAYNFELDSLQATHRKELEEIKANADSRVAAIETEHARKVSEMDSEMERLQNELQRMREQQDSAELKMEEMESTFKASVGRIQFDAESRVASQRRESLEKLRAMAESHNVEIVAMSSKLTSMQSQLEAQQEQHQRDVEAIAAETAAERARHASLLQAREAEIKERIRVLDSKLSGAVSSRVRAAETIALLQQYHDRRENHMLSHMRMLRGQVETLTSSPQSLPSSPANSTGAEIQSPSPSAADRFALSELSFSAASPPVTALSPATAAKSVPQNETGTVEMHQLFTTREEESFFGFNSLNNLSRGSSINSILLSHTSSSPGASSDLGGADDESIVAQSAVLRAREAQIQQKEMIEMKKLQNTLDKLVNAEEAYILKQESLVGRIQESENRRASLEADNEELKQRDNELAVALDRANASLAKLAAEYETEKKRLVMLLHEAELARNRLEIALETQRDTSMGQNLREKELMMQIRETSILRSREQESFKASMTDLSAKEREQQSQLQEARYKMFVIAAKGKVNADILHRGLQRELLDAHRSLAAVSTSSKYESERSRQALVRRERDIEQHLETLRRLHRENEILRARLGIFPGPRNSKTAAPASSQLQQGDPSAWRDAATGWDWEETPQRDAIVLGGTFSTPAQSTISSVADADSLSRQREQDAVMNSVSKLKRELEELRRTKDSVLELASGRRDFGNESENGRYDSPETGFVSKKDIVPLVVASASKLTTRNLNTRIDSPVRAMSASKVDGLMFRSTAARQIIPDASS